VSDSKGAEDLQLREKEGAVKQSNGGCKSRRKLRKKESVQITTMDLEVGGGGGGGGGVGKRGKGSVPPK